MSEPAEAVQEFGGDSGDAPVLARGRPKPRYSQ
jgi:hypothetical protein